MEKPMDLRVEMPSVAALVDERRKLDGVEWVNDCIKRAIRGEPDYFYAFEAGHVLGTPFRSDPITEKVVRMSISYGARFAMVMRNKVPSVNGPA